MVWLRSDFSTKTYLTGKSLTPLKIDRFVLEFKITHYSLIFKL